MSRHGRTLQKTIPIAVVPKTATIDPMYSSGPKKCRNIRHIAAFFALVYKKTAAIVQIFCSAWIEIIINEHNYTLSSFKLFLKK